jgi:opine dehydrogenase
MTMRITVLGGGNTAFSLAAKLSLDGHQVLLWEHRDFARTIEPLRDSRTIQLEGPVVSGPARISGVTTNAAEALAWSDTLICSVPSYAHEPFIAELAPHLRPRHLLLLMPGNLGSLAFSEALRERGAAGTVIVESDTAPFVCRKTAPDRAVIWGVVERLGVGVLPASQTDEVLPAVQELFPGAHAYADAVECGLSSMNPVVHPAGVLMNAGRIERSRGEFWFYDEGVTPAVCRVIEQVDAERLAVGRALGYDLLPVAEGFHAAGLGPKGDLWSVINGSRMLTSLRAPGSLESRWLSEDVPYGIGTWAALGDELGVDTPVIDALVALASAVLGVDCAAACRTFSQSQIAEARANA